MRQSPSPTANPRPDPLDPSTPLNQLAEIPGPGWGPVPPRPPSSTANPDDLPAGAVYGEAIGGQADESASSAPAGRIRISDTPLTKDRAAPFVAIARGGLDALGGFLNSRLAVHDDDLSFIPDDDDNKNVPPPVGRIMARRVPVDISGANLSDIEDMAAAAVTLGAWAIKGLSSMWRERREVRRARKGAGVYQPGDDEPGQ